jgi:protein-tyrosine phosphatase
MSERQQMATPADRRITLEGASNFRDFGGYDAGGGRIRTGALYRSGALSRLTPADIATLNGLGLGAIVDLRTPGERTAAPTPGALTAAEAMFPLSIGTGEGVNAVPRPALLTVADATAEQAVAAIKDSYRRFVIEYGPTFASLFDVLLGGAGVPTVIHCTAGKDRTGISAALILLALGVERDVIIDDYAMTTRYLDLAWRERILTAMLGDVSTVNHAVADVMFAAHPDYMHAAFAAMDERFGSAERYLRDILRLDRQRIGRLQAVFMA